MSRKYIILTGTVVVLSLFTASPALAATKKTVEIGTVSSVEGNLLTIEVKKGKKYTIDASSAEVVKGSEIIDVSDIQAGDTLIVRNT